MSDLKLEISKQLFSITSFELGSIVKVQTQKRPHFQYKISPYNNQNFFNKPLELFKHFRPQIDFIWFAIYKEIMSNGTGDERILLQR